MRSTFDTGGCLAERDGTMLLAFPAASSPNAGRQYASEACGLRPGSMGECTISEL